MNEFITNQEYYFEGSMELIQDCTEIKYLKPSEIYIGKFIKYLAIPWVGDTLIDAQSKFEFGIIPKGSYDKIKHYNIY